MRSQRSSASQTLWTGIIEHPHSDAHTLTHQQIFLPAAKFFLSSQFFPLKSWSTRTESSFVIGACEKNVRVILRIFLTHLQRTVTGHWTSAVHQRNGANEVHTHKGEVHSASKQVGGLILSILVVLTYLPLLQTVDRHVRWSLFDAGTRNDDILADVSVVGLSLSVWPPVLVGGELGPVRGTFSIPRCALYRFPILFAFCSCCSFTLPSLLHVSVALCDAVQ